MVITERYYPYPVLGGKAKAFADGCEFSAKFSPFANSKKAVVKIELTLNDPSIEALVDEGTARIVCHVECPATAYRVVHPLKKGEENIVEMPSGQVAGRVQLSVAVVAAKEIPDYANTSLVGIYKDRHFKVDQGGLLAVAEGFAFDLELKDKRLSDSRSPVAIAPSDDPEAKMITVDSQAHEICIYLPKSQFALYRNMDDAKSVSASASRNHEMLVSLVVVPALVQVLSEIAALKKNDGVRDTEQFSQFHWFAPINNRVAEFLKGEGVEGDLTNVDFKTYPALVLAQAISDSPLCGAFKKLED